jgi:hypothetical protein
VAYRLCVFAASFLAACFVALGFRFSEVIAAYGSYYLALYESIYWIVVKLSHASSSFNLWMMFGVASVLVFFRLRRKHHAVFSHAQLSFPEPVDQSAILQSASESPTGHVGVPG